MTLTIERHHDVGMRRPRHRLAEPAFAAVSGTVTDAARDVGRAIADRLPIDWTLRMTARVVAVALLVVVLLLGFGALMLVQASGGPPYAPRVTPSPTPYPGGWTYGP